LGVLGHLMVARRFTEVATIIAAGDFKSCIHLLMFCFFFETIVHVYVVSSAFSLTYIPAAVGGAKKANISKSSVTIWHQTWCKKKTDLI
jgi:hypothetical protein